MRLSIFSSNCVESVRSNFTFSLFTCVTLAANNKPAASVCKLVIFFAAHVEISSHGNRPVTLYSLCTGVVDQPG